MDAIVFIAVGIAVGIFISTLRKRQESAPALTLPTLQPAASQTDNIYELAQPLGEHFQSTVHPKDVLANPQFVTAAETLANSTHPNDELLEYLVADAPLISTLVLEALGLRHDTGIGEAIMMRLNSFHSAWSRYFALRAIQASVTAEQPILGRIVASVDQSWTQEYLGQM